MDIDVEYIGWGSDYGKNYEEIKGLLNELIGTKYEYYIKAIISIEEGIDDFDILEYLYTRYMKGDFNLA